MSFSDNPLDIGEKPKRIEFYVDTEKLWPDMTREEMLERAKERPFKKFISFPIDVTLCLFSFGNHMFSVTEYERGGNVRHIYTCSQCGHQEEENEEG